MLLAACGTPSDVVSTASDDDTAEVSATTNVTEPISIEPLNEDIKSKVCMGLKIPC